MKAPLTFLLALLLATPALAQRRARLDYEPPDPVPADAAAWEAIGPGLHGAVGSLDERYARSAVPAVGASRRWRADAWRGERVHEQLILWSRDAREQVRLEPSALRGPGRRRIPVRARFVRYVLADQRLVGDILDDAVQLDLPARSARPVWVSVDVPADAAPGNYRGALLVRAAGGSSVSFDLEIEVLPRTLPAPGDWAFYLDLWQNPYALARYHRVEPFSEAHFALLRPHLLQLAAAGQKVLTATIVHAPWGGQTFDAYGSMVAWVKGRDGRFRWDFSLFDRYVAFGLSCGVGPFINCYSMVPWTNQLRYRDEASGEYATLALEPGKPEYAAVWGPFLQAFSRHLKAKGWLARTRIAMDERPLPQMRAAWDLVRKNAPGLGIALAGGHDAEFREAVTDWCAYLTPPLSAATLAARRAKGLPTTFYVCCNPSRPNTFTFSPPAEAVWIGLYAAGHGYTGFLRWAFDSWTEDPLYDTKHVTWDAGDCFLVYPGPRSSIRFERLREGIQEFEKIRLLRRERAGTPEAAALEKALAALTLEKAQSEAPVAPEVNAARAAIRAASLRRSPAGSAGREGVRNEATSFRRR